MKNDEKLYQNIQKRLEGRLDFTNKNDDIRNLLIECNKIQDNEQGYKSINLIFQAIQKSGQKVQLSDSDQIQIVKSCKSLAILGFLYNQDQIKLQNKEKEFRENIRYQIDELQIQGSLEKAFLFDVAIKCDNKEQFIEISTIIKLIVNVLIYFGSDSFHFTQIFDVIINALLLTGNNTTIGKDHQLLSILDQLQKLLEETTSPYLWTIILESILNASRHTDKPTDFVQPNLIARIILSKIPFINDLFNYFGKYLGRCYKFEYKMFQSMLYFGVTESTLDMILRFSKYFVKNYQTEILIEMRKNLIPKLIKYMKATNYFDQIQELFNYFLISSQQQQLSDQQLDLQHFDEIITNYDDNFDFYSEKQLHRIANFLTLIPQGINKTGLKNYGTLETKLRAKHMFNQQISRSMIEKTEQIQYWFNEEIQQAEKSQPTQKLVGLRNLLNTCYLNSFIQALFWSLDFRDLIMNKFKREEIEFLKPFSLKTSFLRCFLFMDSMTEEIDYTPLLLKRALREPYKTDIRQQDAAEFGVHLFEDMENNFDPTEYSQIKEIFYGVSKSVFQCKNCEKQTKGPNEEFMYITLNFENDRNVQEDIEKMIWRHQVNEQITFKCDQCKNTSQSTRTLEFSKLPKNLIILINRFEFEQGNRYKINDSINIKPIIQIKENQKSLNYELYSIIIHFGQTPDMGHYTVYCKVKEDWHRFDDSIVSKIDRDFTKVQRNFKKEETPYLLFYRRKNG
ncbi:unnamed protein product (macronuclear) [Paramecium tetraurelia]|uniref:USP domain-containing protein n=1 Tax=Paramecium tetraurelia TaxID=5888 RepID=A0DNX3_PARTE|nr:uncharacterized protein GSPATT00018936001 [Paramecium tetraurelia]CAK84740.1 unnamed protein product [Paramecium tetraurelia]|eukprot:XP_001452137.1 hypothetical protein (macronuclear) [Paramecium tetraurelia strain d4-2]